MQSMNHFPCDMVYNDEDFTERFAQLMTSIFKQIYDYNILYDYYFAQQEEEEIIDPDEKKYDKILIDDMEQTINEWNKGGGIGILHTSAADTIKQLKKLRL